MKIIEVKSKDDLAALYKRSVEKTGNEDSFTAALSALGKEEITKVGRVMGFRKGTPKQLIAAILKKLRAQKSPKEAKKKAPTKKVETKKPKSLTLREDPEIQKAMPDIDPGSYELLRHSISQGWQKGSKILITEDGRILDGHHRYRALKELKIPVTEEMVEVVEPTDDKLLWVAKLNLIQTRNLSPLQRLLWFGRKCETFIDSFYQAKYGERESLKGRLAAEISVSTSSLERFERARVYTPEYVEAALSREGDVSVRALWGEGEKALKYIRKVDEYTKALNKEDKSIEPTFWYDAVMRAGRDAREKGTVARIKYEGKELTLLQLADALYEEYGDMKSPKENKLEKAFEEIRKRIDALMKKKYGKNVKLKNLDKWDKQILKIIVEVSEGYK